MTKTLLWILLRIEDIMHMLRNSKAVCTWLHTDLHTDYFLNRISQRPYVIGIYLNVPKCDLQSYIITITIVSIISYIFFAINCNKLDLYQDVKYKCVLHKFIWRNVLFCFRWVGYRNYHSRRWGFIIRRITESIIPLSSVSTINNRLI